MMRRLLKTIAMRCGAALWAALFASVSAFAEPVVVTSQGGLTLRGEVMGYDGTYLRLSTDYGPVTLAYSGVTCEGTRCPDPDGPAQLRFAGARRLGEVLLPALVEAYARQKQIPVRSVDQDGALQYILGTDTEPVLQVDFRLLGSSEGFKAQISGVADVVMADRPVLASENDASVLAGMGTLSGEARARIIALDAFVPVVSRSQAITVISLDDLANVFAGEVTGWDAFGGEARHIRTLLPEDGGQVESLGGILLPGRTLGAGLERIGTVSALAETIAADPDAIGILPMGSFANTVPMVLRDVCGLKAIPRRTSLKTGDYPLTVPLYLYLPDYRLSAEAADFLRWLRGIEAQAVIRRAGFVDQGPVPIGWDEQGERLMNAVHLAGKNFPLSELQQMLDDLDGMARLSTTFRFDEGSTQLSAVSQSNLLFIAQAIKAGQYSGRHLALIGFSDGNGSAEANRALSIVRAETVRTALIDALGGEFPSDVELTTSGYGEALPMGCDETDWGRRMNRRVELWIDN